MIATLEKELMILSNKARYISEVLEGTIDLRKKKESEIINMLSEKEYDKLDNDEQEYNYLLKMPMYSVSEEKVKKLNKEYEDKKEELERIKETTIQQMWLYELELLEKEYEVFCDERKNALLGELNTKDTSNKKQSSNKNKIVITSKKIVKKASNIDFIQEDNEEEIIDFTPKNKKK
jgi:DNA topoisomerase-2